MYDPTNGDPYSGPVTWRPRTCFLMTRLGPNVPPVVSEIRNQLERVLKDYQFNLVDAASITTGKDLLSKIWRIICGVPLGVVVIYPNMPRSTLGNVFYELGLMQAMGKETLVIKTPKGSYPSDLVRTEYVVYDGNFDVRMRQFMEGLQERAEYLYTISEQVDKNPLLAIDYCRRAFLITGDVHLKDKAKQVFESAGLGTRAKNSVEILLANF